MRKKIVAGNWKMNGLNDDAISLAKGIDGLLKGQAHHADIVFIAPPFPFIASVVSVLNNSRSIHIAAQNCSDKVSGAFTGEVSAQMVKSAGASYVIVGHSERRTYFIESDEVIGEKINRVLENDMTPVFCCGEVLSQRQSGMHFDIVKNQVETALFKLNEDQFGKVVIAYEPVWAIGTGETATPAQAQEMHVFIRGLVAKKFGQKAATECSILYGGSCNEKNAKELFALPDVDGGLIGGASLKAQSFVEIIKSLPS